MGRQQQPSDLRRSPRGPIWTQRDDRARQSRPWIGNLVAIEAALGVRTPVSFAAPALALDVRSGTEFGPAMASFRMDKVHLEADADLKLRGGLLLTVAQRPALGGLMQAAVDGEVIRVCTSGGLVDAGVVRNANRVRVCAASGSSSSASTDSSWLRNVTVELLDASKLSELPCVFPFDVCPTRTRAQLEKLPSSTVTLLAEMPLPASFARGAAQTQRGHQAACHQP